MLIVTQQTDKGRDDMQHKMGFSTLRWVQPDLEQALTALKQAGWDGWEARLAPEWLGTPKRLRRVCADAGMPLAVYTGGSPDQRDPAHVEINRRRMEYAAEMEVDCFMFMSGPKPKDREVSKADIEAAAAGAEEWASYAAQFGLELSYHIHTNLLIDSSSDWIYYMGLLDYTKLCIDVSHAELWGYDPTQAIADFRGQLNYVHLQDFNTCRRDEEGKYEPEWCDVGVSANVDFAAILEILEKIDYSRWITACPGPGRHREDAIAEAERSAVARRYLRELGY